MESQRETAEKMGKPLCVSTLNNTFFLHFEQGAPQFHFSLSLTNYVTDPDSILCKKSADSWIVLLLLIPHFAGEVRILIKANFDNIRK